MKNRHTTMNIDLTGRGVLVTGASRGIGRAIALALGRAGARVAVHFRERSDEAHAVAGACGPASFAVQGDLALIADCARVFDRCLSDLGGLDALVNNAGLCPEMPLDMPDEAFAAAFDRTIAVNLRAAEYLSRRAIGHFTEHGGGRILHVSSRAAFRGDTPEFMTYAASKAGMVALSRSIARAFGRRGIVSFVIAPGFVRTDMAQESVDLYGEDHILKDIALARLTEPEDLAPLAVLLVSGLADHATGGTFDVNAGSYVR